MEAAAPLRTATIEPAALERSREGRHPISRWYLCPAAGWFAAALVASPVRPNWLSFGGLGASAAAAAVLVCRPNLAPAAALLVLLAWFFDRADGQLARLQGTASRLGAWFDANLDELEDLGLHAAVAATVSWQYAAAWPWALLVAFLAGKYLFMYGLAAEETFSDRSPSGKGGRHLLPEWPDQPSVGARCFAQKVPATFSRLAWLYHLPANADVRVHLLVGAMACGWLAAELAFVAAYYNFRWLVRYVLVARRLGGSS
jgi:phosphatidylglycerophosphate synthase